VPGVVAVAEEVFLLITPVVAVVVAQDITLVALAPLGQPHLVYQQLPQVLQGR
jgi:hypothetical protein